MSALEEDAINVIKYDWGVLYRPYRTALSQESKVLQSLLGIVFRD
jgi:hypothetical protein